MQSYSVRKFKNTKGKIYKKLFLKFKMSDSGTANKR